MNTTQEHADMLIEIVEKLKSHQFQTNLDFTIGQMRGPVDVIAGVAIESGTKRFGVVSTVEDMVRDCIKEIEDDLVKIKERFQQFTYYVYAPYQLWSNGVYVNPTNNEEFIDWYFRYGKKVGETKSDLNL